MEVRLKNKRDRAAELLSYHKQTPERVNWLLTTILIGNNLALVGFAMAAEAGLLSDTGMGPLEQLLGLEQAENPLLFTLILSIITTPIILIIAEFIPKAIFKTAADKMVYPSMYILRVFYYLFFIPVWLINMVVRGIQALFKLNRTKESRNLNVQDLGSYLKGVFSEIGDTSEFSEQDMEMFDNAIAFRGTKVREFMIPRTDIKAVPIEASLEELREHFIETQLSKLILHGENLDDVQGYVHSMRMFEPVNSVADVKEDVLIIPESMLASDLLAEFTTHKKTLAIVVDEFGGTSGLVTMEDLIEEIFGDIEDEYDKEEIAPEEDTIFKINEDGSFLVGARWDIDDLNEQKEFHFPEDEAYTTLGGLFMHVAEMIPEIGQEVQVEDYTLQAINVAPNRIISIIIIPETILPEES